MFAIFSGNKRYSSLLWFAVENWKIVVHYQVHFLHPQTNPPAVVQFVVACKKWIYFMQCTLLPPAKKVVHCVKALLVIVGGKTGRPRGRGSRAVDLGSVVTGMKETGFTQVRALSKR
jgi:hypothetical protein